MATAIHNDRSMFDLAEKLPHAVTYLIALILSICVHEFGHAFVADWLGDRLPRAQGRVTLNPMVHIDPIGTLLMPLIQVFTGAPVLGWGRPVMTSLSARDLNRRFSLKFANLLISAAGPAMNLVFAAVLSVLYVIMLRFGGDGDKLLALSGYVAFVINLNLMLACFNLIPCPPLDGGAILHGVLPRRLEWITERLQRYGFIVLFALFYTGVLSFLMRPAGYAALWWLHTLDRWVVR
jgi:Zn-dependent protease